MSSYRCNMRLWRAPPPAWYIDALMRREGQADYVGLLKAAELHGAPHQAVMEFQVVTAKRLPWIRAGRSLIVFCFRKDMKAVTEDSKTHSGRMKLSSAALTALDLQRYPQASGGMDNIATVLSALGRKIDPEQLAALPVAVERPVVQRLGYFLDPLGHDAQTGPMLLSLRARGSLPWTEPDRREARDPDFAPEPRQRGLRWWLIARAAAPGRRMIPAHNIVA